MATEHEEVQEALAARALRSLDEAEQARVEALLAAHLPVCADCRQALEEFEAVAGDLALATPSRRPPPLLAARLRKELLERPGSPIRRLPVFAAAGAIAALIGVGIWNIQLADRVSRAERQQASTAELISAVSHPQSHVLPLIAGPAAQQTGTQVTAVFVPGGAHLYVVGSMPAPSANRVYQLWLGRGGGITSGGTFVPGPHGTVLLRLSVDTTTLDRVFITEEPEPGSDRPSSQRVVDGEL